jgi:hypothetical protein
VSPLVRRPVFDLQTGLVFLLALGGWVLICVLFFPGGVS